MRPNDADAETVRDYLISLLSELWWQAEGFSGKRPWGNSDWQWTLYASLVEEGLADGSFDEDGYLDALDRRAAHALVSSAIESLREGLATAEDDQSESDDSENNED